jgi:hypothetical protein
MGAKTSKVVPEATPVDANPNIPDAGVALYNIDAVPVGSPPRRGRFVNSVRDTTARVFPSVNTRQREIPSAIATPLSDSELRLQLNAERRRRLRPIIENDPLIRELRRMENNSIRRLNNAPYEDRSWFLSGIHNLGSRIIERERQIYADYETYPS